MARIENEFLKKCLIAIMFNLLQGENKPEILKNIQFIIVDDMFQLANTDIESNKHCIRFSHKLSRIVKTRRGLDMAHAIFAHELGHLEYHFSLKTIPTTQPSLDFFIEAERGADKIAVKLLKKVFPKNAVAILLAQAKHALKRSLKSKRASEDQIRLAILYFQTREAVLFEAA